MSRTASNKNTASSTVAVKPTAGTHDVLERDGRCLVTYTDKQIETAFSACRMILFSAENAVRFNGEWNLADLQACVRLAKEATPPTRISRAPSAAVKATEQPPSETTKVIERIATHFRVTVEAVCGQERNHHVARARHVAIWILTQRLELTTREIGPLFNRDNSSVAWSLRRLADEMSVDRRLSNEVATLVGTTIAQPIAV